MSKWFYNSYERSSSFRRGSTAERRSSSVTSLMKDDDMTEDSFDERQDVMKELWSVQQQQMIEEESEEKSKGRVPGQVLLLSTRDLSSILNQELDEAADSSKQQDDHQHHNHEATGGQQQPGLLSMVTSEDAAVQDLLQDGYGKPLPKEQAAKIVPPSPKGLVWNALVIPDDYYCSETGEIVIPELVKKSNRDFDPITKAILPQRASLPMTLSELRSSLTKTDDNRWIFHGVLNGWPSLRALEVVSVEHKRASGSMATPSDFLKGRVSWVVDWKASYLRSSITIPKEEAKEHEIDDDGLPDVLTKDTKNKDLDKVWQEGRLYRVKLKGPEWSAIGWSPDAPGFLYWFEWHKQRLSYGTNVVKTVDDNTYCTMVHMISHRYAVRKESTRDRLTYHSIVLLEWDHGEYCTVVEGAYLNGIAGYKGKSNWYHDKAAAGGSRLYHCFPPECIAPWFSNAAEIRCFDVEARNIEEMQEFINQYNGENPESEARFLDPQLSFSHSARLSYRSKRNIGQYLLNYIGRDCSYSELRRNCQTLAADLCGFLCAKKNVEPFHAVSRLEYRNRSHFFLYEANMFTPKEDKKQPLLPPLATPGTAIRLKRKTQLDAAAGEDDEKKKKNDENSDKDE